MEQLDEEVQSIIYVANKSYKKLVANWEKTGYDHSSIAKRKQAVVKHATELFNDMVAEEDDKIEEIDRQLNEVFAEIQQLLKDLTMDDALAVDAKHKAQGKNLLQKEKIFRNVVEDLRKRKGIRMEKYNKLNDKLVEITEELDEELFTVKYEGIPSDAQVGQIEQKLLHLQNEKLRRQNLFKKLKKEINDLFRCLEQIPKNPLERLIYMDESTSESIKVLSSNTLKKMEQMLSELKQEVSNVTANGDNMWLKIRELWSRLTIDEEIQLAFEKVNHPVITKIGDQEQPIYKPSSIRGLQIELAKLEEAKRENMALFITQVRDELTRIWKEKCLIVNVDVRFSDENYSHLTDFTQDDFISESYTEELLDKHEREINYWRDFVQRHQRILDNFLAWESAFAQYKELELKADDKNRYNNRGGALLQEQKLRVRLEKSIPKLENDLKDLCQHFAEDQDAEHGMKKFLVYGKEMEMFIRDEWDNFHVLRQRSKESKKKEAGAAGKSMMGSNSARPGKRPATPGGITTPKRARPGTFDSISNTPTTTPGLRSCLTTRATTAANAHDEDDFARPTTPGRRLVAKRKFITAASSGTTTKIPSGKPPTGSAKEQIHPTNLAPIVKSPASSYSEFTDHLLCQSTLNSSAVSAVTVSTKSRVPLSSNIKEAVTPTKPKRNNPRQAHDIPQF